MISVFIYRFCEIRVQSVYERITVHWGDFCLQHKEQNMQWARNIPPGLYQQNIFSVTFTFQDHPSRNRRKKMIALIYLSFINNYLWILSSTRCEVIRVITRGVSRNFQTQPRQSNKNCLELMLAKAYWRALACERSIPFSSSFLYF